MKREPGDLPKDFSINLRGEGMSCFLLILEMASIFQTFCCWKIFSFCNKLLYKLEGLAMKKHKKLSSLFLIFVLSVTFLYGCGKNGDSKPAGNNSKEETKLSIKDSTGKDIEINLPVNKVVTLNRQTSEALKVLGVGDKVVATGDNTVKYNPYLGFNNLPDLGVDKINIEEVLSLKPDIVFAHTNRNTEVLEEKLEPAGIKVVRIDNYLPEKMDEEMRLLGKIFNKSDRAEGYIKWKNDLEKLTTDKIKDIPDSQKKSVMALSSGALNSKNTFNIFPSKSQGGKPGVGEGYATILAGGKDAAGELEWDPTKKSTTVNVDSEYVISKNPQVITLNGTWLGGYNETDPAKFKEVVKNIMKNETVTKLDAAKNKEIYIFHTDMLGANKRAIGLLQLSKYLYPEKFKDVDTEKYAKEYFQKWLDTDYKGIWFYSVKDDFK